MTPIFIAGPCVIESAEILDEVAAKIVDIQKKLGVKCYFKASFDKANRTSIHSYRGPGLEKGLQMLADVKSKYHLPLLTDIHASRGERRKAPGRLCTALQLGSAACCEVNCGRMKQIHW